MKTSSSVYRYKGSDLGITKKRIDSPNKTAVLKFLCVLKQVNECFNNSKKILLEKIIDNKTYNVPPILEKFTFDFVSVIKDIEDAIALAAEKVRAECKTEVMFDDRMSITYSRLHAKYELKEAAELGDEKDFWEMRLWENEVVSFFLHFSKFFETWECRDMELRSTRKVNWNSMQVAKSMEKCLYANIAPFMMNLINGELHCAKILMLNDTGHEEQISRNDKFINLIFRFVPIRYNLGDDVTNHDIERADNLKIYASALADRLKSIEHLEEGDEDLTLSQVGKKTVFRRGRGQLIKKLRQFMQHCIQTEAYCTVLLDESQNATGKAGVYHKLMAGVMVPEQFDEIFADSKPSCEEDELVEDKEETEKAAAELGDYKDNLFKLLLKHPYIRAEYWTATPPHHHGTTSEHSYGVVGLCHTGIHCVNNVWIKNIAGVYMDSAEADGQKPNLKYLEGFKCDIDGVERTPMFYNPNLYASASTYRSFTKRAKNQSYKKITHEQYREICHRIFAELIEYQVANTAKVMTQHCIDPTGNPWIAMRVTRQNALTESLLIPGIQKYLKNPKKFLLETYNMDTKKRKEYEKIASRFYLRKFCKFVMSKSENAGKSLVVFFTARGRCGDQFPTDFRSFIEIPGLNCFDLTVLLQSFYGRSNGYFKGTPDVLMPYNQANQIEEYIALGGVVPDGGTARGTVGTGNLSMTQTIQIFTPIEDSYYDKKELRYQPESHEFENLNPVLQDAVLKLEKSFNENAPDRQKASNHTNEDTKGIYTYVPIEAFTKFVIVARESGIDAVEVNDLSNFYRARNGQYMRHVYMEPGASRPEYIKIKNRTTRKCDDGIGGGTAGEGRASSNAQYAGGDEIFHPTFTWHHVFSSEGKRIGKKLVSIQLLMRNSMHWPADEPLRGKGNYPFEEFNKITRTSSRKVDPEKSALAYIDGQIDHSENKGEE